MECDRATVTELLLGRWSFSRQQPVVECAFMDAAFLQNVIQEFLASTESRTNTFKVSFHSFAVGLHAVLNAWFVEPDACVRAIRNLQGDPCEEPCVIYRKVFANPKNGVSMHITVICLKYEPKIAREVEISVRPVERSQ